MTVDFDNIPGGKSYIGDVEIPCPPRDKPLVRVSGHVTLSACVNQVQPITFEFRPADGSPSFHRDAVLEADCTFTLSDIPGLQSAQLHQSWLRSFHHAHDISSTNERSF